MQQSTLSLIQLFWEIKADLITFFAANVPAQNLESDFDKSMRLYNLTKRYCQKQYFSRLLPNGELVQREWLIYSPSARKVIFANFSRALMS